MVELYELQKVNKDTGFVSTIWSYMKYCKGWKFTGRITHNIIE
mgnify:CR=1 FL=1